LRSGVSEEVKHGCAKVLESVFQKSGQGDAGTEEGYAQEWERPAGKKSEASHRNRPIASTQGREEGTKEKEEVTRLIDGLHFRFILIREGTAGEPMSGPT
jgi:hypothetical protein